MLQGRVVRLAKWVAEAVWYGKGAGWLDLLGNPPNQSNRNSRDTNFLDCALDQPNGLIA